MPRLAQQLAAWVGGGSFSVDLCGASSIQALLSGATFGTGSASASLLFPGVVSGSAAGQSICSASFVGTAPQLVDLAGSFLIDSNGANLTSSS